MANEKDIIDLGSVTVPTKWDDITLKKFSEIERYYSDKDKKFNVIDVLDILIDKDRDYIMSLPSEFLESILSKMSFLQTSPKTKEPSNKVTIKGETYIVKTMEKLKTGEYVAADGIIKSDPHNYAAIMAILCRKDGETYDSHYEAEVLDDRIKFWEDQPVTEILPVVSFFLTCYATLEIPSRLYSKVEEAVKHIQQSIDSSDRIGASKRFFLNLRMKRLRKSLRSINNTSRTRSLSSRISLKKARWKRKKTLGRKTGEKQ